MQELGGHGSPAKGQEGAGRPLRNQGQLQARPLLGLLRPPARHHRQTVRAGDVTCAVTPLPFFAGGR